MNGNAPNPFYVHPGGDMSQGLAGIASTVGKIQEQRREESKEQKALDKFNAIKAEAQEVLKTRDPDLINAFILRNPEFSQAVKMSAMASGQDVARQSQIYDNALRYIDAEDDSGREKVMDDLTSLMNEDGVSPKQREDIQSFLQKHYEEPDKALTDAKLLLVIGDNERWNKYAEFKGIGGKEEGTANIKDWKHYRKLQVEDPEQAKQFALQIGIKEDKGQEIKPTVAMQNYAKWESMEDGPEKKAFSKMIGISAKDSPSEARSKLKDLDENITKLNTADETVGMIDKLLETPGYIDALTGFRGATPFSVPGGTGYDAMIAFEQFKDSLTLENMSKMTGILSDSDIKILRSAAAGLQAGMSEEAFVKKLKEIKGRIVDNSKRMRSKVGDFDKTAYSSDQNSMLPDGVTEEDITYTMSKHGMTREQVMNRLKGGQ